MQAAIKAYEAALQEWTQERVPLDWAMTQNNLGNALQTLGAREGDGQRLQAAIKAYEAALQERTQERVPLDWAATLYNLSLAKQAIATLQDQPLSLNLELLSQARDIFARAGSLERAQACQRLMEVAAK